MPKISFQLKIILSIVFFTLFVTGLERYFLSENIINQFKKSQESKNQLLLDTISPILSLNISLGLDDSNKDFLEQIIKTNSDLAFLQLLDKDKNTLYQFVIESKEIKKAPSKHHAQELRDSITSENIGQITVLFSDAELLELKKQNRITTLKIIAIVIILLAIFVAFIRREFKDLKLLSEKVLKYDPKLNNCFLVPSKRTDEIGIVHNAIISMISKINLYTKTLDDMNLSLDTKVRERTKELEAANKKLELLSTIDPLTQVSNRRHFETYFKEMWKLAIRKSTSISIIMCDIDYFKNVNDKYGHQVGDEVLKGIAATIEKSLKRSTDCLARYGGEEFIILMYDTEIDEATNICEKIQENIRSIDSYAFKDIKSEPVTLSYGVSATVPDKDSDYENLIKSADTALYKAKESGRDCIASQKYI